MDPIPDININLRNIDIPETQIWDVQVPNTIPRVVPVTQLIGTPVVNIPGCITAHEKSDKNDTIVNDDPKGTKVFCDGQVPSYDPIQYEPEQMVITRPSAVPKVPSPEQPTPPAPEIPRTPPQTAIVEETKPEPEPEIPWTEEYLPPLGTVTTTASIAVVATTSALLAKPLADLLLKVIKPTVKKVIKKIAAIRGKTVKVESLKERRGQQRIRNKAIRILKGRE